MKVGKTKPRDEIEDHERHNNDKQQGRCNHHYPLRLDVVERIDNRTLWVHMSAMAGAVITGGMGVVPNAFGDDRNKAKLEIRSPSKGLEEKIPGPLKCK